MFHLHVLLLKKIKYRKSLSVLKYFRKVMWLFILHIFLIQFVHRVWADYYGQSLWHSFVVQNVISITTQFRNQRENWNTAYQLSLLTAYILHLYQFWHFSLIIQREYFITNEVSHRVINSSIPLKLKAHDSIFIYRQSDMPNYCSVHFAVIRFRIGMIFVSWKNVQRSELSSD